MVPSRSYDEALSVCKHTSMAALVEFICTQLVAIASVLENTFETINIFESNYLLIKTGY